ncbi:MAG: DUF4349 domain-containing protein [Flavobacteriales bacterium]|nr:DUF4349 domain-containing protein [Flavobacteriales bacterium]MCB9198271.1 DUF4349 domain-containing protein [Flavobacteriales bacterium]
MRKNIKFFAAIFLLSIVSCGSNEHTLPSESKETGGDYAYKSAPHYEYEGELAQDGFFEEDQSIMKNKLSSNMKVDQSGIEVMSQMLIKTGNIGYETDGIYDQRTKINQLIKQYGAYVANESEDYYGNRINQYLTIKIPSKNFELFLEGVCDGVDKFDNKNIYVQDVTEEFVDTETRIANKKALEQKYIALLDKAHSIEDILEIENQINYLREDIEVAEAHLKSLSSQISYSILDLYIYEKTSEETHLAEPENRFVSAIKGGWSSVVDFFVDLTYAWPSLLVLAILIILGSRLWKKRIKAKLFGKD